MESVFISVLDLSPDARIKFCSDSIEDILGYSPHEVTGHSCWDYFHRDEVVFAQEIHSRGVDLDKAAVLNYCRIKHKDGSWIGCECVFSVVHDVLVASTSVYKRGPKARRRALEGANVRRIFSSSPRDPRYHMLSYLSSKFYQAPQPHSREDRAALFLNRFTRTSTIMFATNGVSQILGLQPDQLIGKSFYYCIDESCLQDAVKCLESAKSNDSIAYLRFWYRDPLQSVSRAHSVVMEDTDDTDEEDSGGVPIGESSRSNVEMRDSATPQLGGVSLSEADGPDVVPHVNGANNVSAVGDVPNPAGAVHNGFDGNSRHSRTFSDRIANEPPALRDRMADLDRAIEERVVNRLPPGLHTRPTQSSLGTSTDLDGTARDAVFDPPDHHRSSSSQTSPDEDRGIEVEAVISCSSDGLVVVLRKAHPLVPPTLGATATPQYANGFFASPWAPEPVMPSQVQQSPVAPQIEFPTMPEPAEAGFMAAIRDVAVFAWALTGINGSLAQYSVGKRNGEALPPGGLPIWDPNDPNGKLNDMYNGFVGSRHRPQEGMGVPLFRRGEESSSSGDEVVWKREPTMSV